MGTRGTLATAEAFHSMMVVNAHQFKFNFLFIFSRYDAKTQMAT